MSWYELLLFVHISAAAVWLGGALMFQAYALVVLKGGDTREMATFAGRAGRLGERLFAPAALLVLLAGIGLMVEGSWDWGRLWVLFALATFAGSFASGILHIAPMSKKLEVIGAETPEGQDLIRRIFTSSRIELVFLYAIVFAMTVKPTLDDRWTLGIAALVMAVATAAIVVRSRATSAAQRLS